MRQVSLLVFLLLFALPFIVEGQMQCNELVNGDLNELRDCDGSVLGFTLDKDKVLNLDKISDEDAKAIFIGNTVKYSRLSMSIKKTTVKKLEFGIELRRNVTIEIHDNELLEEITVVAIRNNTPIVDGWTATIDVRRNKNLTPESLSKLRKLDWGPEFYIQDPGECDFQNAPIPSLDSLVGCRYVYGDFVIDKKTELTKPNIASFSEIRGCLKISNSEKLTDLWFVENVTSTNCSTGKNEIKKNSKLCLNSEEIFYLKSGLGDVTISDNKKCNNTCTPKWLLARNDTIPCHTVNGDLVITGITADTKLSDLKHLANVEVINGRLSIHHNKISEITFFSKLHTVNNNETLAAAIHVFDNKNMAVFNFSSLTSINVSGSQVPLMVVENNNNTYYLPDEDIARYGKIGRMRFRPEKPKPSRAPRPLTSFNTSSSEDDKNEGSEDSSEESIDESEKWKLALEIVGGVLGVVILIVLLVLIVFFVRKRLARRKFNAKRKTIEKQVKVARKAVATTSTSDPITCRESMFPGASSSFDQPNDGDDGVRQTKRIVGYPAFPKDGKMIRVADFVKNLFNALGGKVNQDYTKLHANDSKMVKITNNGISFTQAQLKPPENMISMKTYVTKISHEMFSLDIGGLSTKEVTISTFSEDQIEDFIQQHMSTSGKVNYEYDALNEAISYCLKDDGYSKKHLVKVDGPCHFVGDIHGSWHDLQAILSLDPEGIRSSLQIHPLLYYKYVFCGDYVDRGILDIQTIIFLAVLAKKWKHRIVMLRGNHEDDMNRPVHKEEKEKQNLLDHLVGNYDLDKGRELQWKFFDLFAHLPFAALINGRIFACHGGIGETHFQYKTLEDAYDTIPMPLKTRDVHHNKIAVDTFWSDPNCYPLSQTTRGSGSFYDKQMVYKFCEKFGVDTIIRGHENVGFAVHFNGKCISLFGCFDTDLAMKGLPSVAGDEKLLNHFNQRLTENSSIAVLRLNADGTLHLMMLRHKYLKHDMEAAK